MTTWSQRDQGLAGLALAALITLGPSAAHATVISASAKLPTCITLTGTATNCADTAFLNTTLVGANSQFIGAPRVGGALATFTTAFDAWDAANGDVWKLVNGGSVAVSTSANIWIDTGADGAGLGPVLFTLSGSPTILKNLVWTQALVVNYSPLLGALSTPIETLDTFSLSQDPAGDNPSFPKSCVAASSGASPTNGAFCGPIYPFQYGTEYQNYSLDGVRLGVDPFYDAPAGDWPNATFDAITLLSSVSQATHTLTVYEGWSYGFTLSATVASAVSSTSGVFSQTIPEPSTWTMMIVGFASLGFAAYRGANGRRMARNAS